MNGEISCELQATSC